MENPVRLNKINKKTVGKNRGNVKTKRVVSSVVKSRIKIPLKSSDKLVTTPRSAASHTPRKMLFGNLHQPSQTKLLATDSRSGASGPSTVLRELHIERNTAEECENSEKLIFSIGMDITTLHL